MDISPQITIPNSLSLILIISFSSKLSYFLRRNTRLWEALPTF